MSGNTEKPSPTIVRTVADLRQTISAWRKAGQTIALVPTMGALHAGHIALVQGASELADRVVASIFVNPTQFGPNEDFDAYPRVEAADVEKLAAVGTDLVFIPTVSEMYPENETTRVSVSGVSEGLCGDARPGHFDGVTTIVAKLLCQVQPDIALFGEKDYQQLQVLKRMARDLFLPVEIRGFPTQREADGLALSSRNAYLSPEERQIAPKLNATLHTIARRLEAGEDAAPLLASGREELLAAGFATVDYLELRAADGLALLERADGPARLLVAAKLGKARLIDNIPVAKAG